MTITRLIELLQPFAERYPEARVYICDDIGNGPEDYNITGFRTYTPTEGNGVPSVSLEGSL